MGKGSPYKSPEELRKRNLETAALLGAGVPVGAITESQHISKRVVGKIRRDIKTDDELREVFEESQRRTMPLVLDVADAALEAMMRGLQKDDCPVHHAAAAYRELAKSAGDAVQRVNDKGAGDMDDLPTKDVHMLMDLLRQMFRDDRQRASRTEIELPQQGARQ